MVEFDTPEIIDIESPRDMGPTITISSIDDEPTASIDINSKPSVNFGGGIELLMNEKRKSNDDGSRGGTADIDLSDLQTLENELNDLSEQNMKQPSKSGLFNKALYAENTVQKNTSNEDNIPIETTVHTESSKPIPIGKATADNVTDEPTQSQWGFGMFKADTPTVDPDKDVASKPKLTPEELIREKFKYLRKLEDLERKGAKLSKRYTMENDLDEMMGEYELIIAEKETSNSVKFQGRMLMAAITGLEFLNNRFDPFDVKLDGWAEQVNENIDDYDEIFTELHEKYRSKAKMAPELKLLFQLGGSAVMVHMTNTMFKSSMPGVDDIMRQNPELMQQFTQAAVNTMGENNPGFGGFMNEFMHDNRGAPPPNATMSGPPPPPMKTQQNRSERAFPPTNRPDLTGARDPGISIFNQEESVGPQKLEQSTPRDAPNKSMPTRDTPQQPSVLDSFASKSDTNIPVRAEMQGPSDISDLLSGLKGRNIDIQRTSPSRRDGSTVSVTELKEMSKSRSDGRSKNRRKSDKSSKNSVAIDL